ncbi:MAG TPA: signal recognition particle-docking protein FtsY [Hellea balneolensis]|uniref:Signal recognition particle receptor FtsY n=1 Tax=Hellea balneolensis TaxID=287478 RepID=A0A7C5M0Z5_9PROT|nr:signal recognition particle-docking protein FtsY [Hellea balneolensis]
MAAINAAALKAARSEDEKRLSEEEKARLEAEEKRAAEEQAQKDAETAKRLAAEKEERERKARLEAEQKAAQAQREAEAVEREKKREEAQRRAREKLAQEQHAQKQQAKAQAVHEARLKAEQDAAKKRDIEAKRQAELEAQRQAAEKQAQLDKLAKEQADAEARRAAEAQRAKREADALKKQQGQDVAAKATETPPPEPHPAPKTQPPPGDGTEPGLDKEGFFARITKGLKKSTSKMSENISAVFTKRKLDAEALEELEDLLIAADFGVGPAMRTTELLAKDRFDKQVTDMEIKIALADVIGDTLKPLEKPLVLSGAKPEILLFVGVNGSGKTTTLGKIAKRFTDEGKKVLLCAGDTFRAAAVEQLKIWGERAGAPVLSAELGADAAGLVYDAVAKAKSEGFDILMIDTAGRLQNRTELMDELAKIVRVIKKQDENAPHHSILVLDATVGQNALSQTEAFAKTAGVTGLIMTKLDGTAKGGVLVALSDKYKLPIHAIGIGERIEDLENFSADVFAAALSGVADAVMNHEANS